MRKESEKAWEAANSGNPEDTKKLVNEYETKKEERLKKENEDLKTKFTDIMRTAQEQLEK